ncbi:tyrosine-protein phosphatase [Xenorhabdus griffiniae]|uniref:Tyrosine-protein phosphatase n=1 Tax=Xenorhabdus griffiniae TaxID=351672 RepID=A0ABY9XK18_9GAMM|nr:tyrosine-protein phosphatase [Xenorhabdus griffiniae]MBD1227119.1 tyrosine-protein phosphatase [Xenorhabdus griffiniae]MBE8586517.1 tyrosine-protein phosphatase [Xenorhabdus griffiniae]WMV73133.1 tyrosine-protein phosphatase [Xenorhabdus griffiniae]WNH02812.1 tyrosine-protein phosphatase [Xenorhabdus griffiniae]
MTTTFLSHPSLLPLNGGINFRDLGNKTLSNGVRIKPGVLFRSGSLDRLTENDQAFLVDQNLLQIIDYRDSSEIMDKPDRVWNGAHYHHAPANPLSKEVDANLDKLDMKILEQFDAKTFMSRLYELLPINNPAYKTLATLLLQPEKGGIVQHCAVGKDRTGVGSALVLFALGADLDTVMEDYLLTNVTLAPYRDYLLNEHAKIMSESVVEKFAYVYSVREEFLLTALDSINQHYGSIDIWLEKDIGLNIAAREKLQAYFLE